MRGLDLGHEEQGEFQPQAEGAAEADERGVGPVGGERRVLQVLQCSTEEF
jgi:hypothetical protein